MGNAEIYRFLVWLILAFGVQATPTYAATPMVSAGIASTCAVLSGGSVQCWGGTSTSNSTAVPGIYDAEVVAVGSAHSCVALSSGVVQCWGDNRDGQLGNGSLAKSTFPVVAIGITNAAGVAAGRAHSCAILKSGGIQCWGSNSWGQIGNGGSAGAIQSPVQVAGINNAVSVSAGDSHSCAVLSNGTLQCWGYNGNGELGLGSTANSSRPTVVV